MTCGWISFPFPDCLPFIVTEPGSEWIVMSQRSCICIVFPFLNVAHYFPIKQQILGRRFLLIITVNNIVLITCWKNTEGMQVANWGGSMIYSKWEASSLLSLILLLWITYRGRYQTKWFGFTLKMLSPGNLHRMCYYTIFLIR